ncbi:uncharacterized protein DUF2470 [Tamaricihabitans halophyticus]|uniref:Uncharacterized protein DUF2470 n=1 Tax=Tamaricihabitans halophyticus TaxID=1262583 RepID=A0A4R2R3J8_9PSEU|nr:DUF2470 domain-containing protein [Tamaricihabitans halophyticus]TCP57143.1 uncharacterized protein DUF2470 [Tamaricihabitans halophyticus]
MSEPEVCAGRRPPAPTPAERARTIAARGGKATLLPWVGYGTEGNRVLPLLHHVHADGTTSLLLDDKHPLVESAWLAPRDELTVMLELADPAPVPLREPVRGLLWITGWLRPLEPTAARQRAVELAKDRPDPRLLDIGYGSTLLRLSPASLVLADAEGTQSMRPATFAEAVPDPFHSYENGWLRHLELSHPDVVGLLAKHLPERLRGGHIRPLGLDRFGLRLRVEMLGDDHDVRLAFSRTVHTQEELAAELRQLLGCPFLAHAK